MAAIVASERITRSGCPASPEDEELLKMAEQCRQRNSEDRIQPVLQAFGVINPETAPR
jgi:guanylate kinase